jgi:four helix bundle protein
MQNDKEKTKKEFKQRLYKFTLSLVEFIDSLPQDNVSRRIGDQLLRSGTSVIGNYVEGQSASSKKDFAKYFDIALKSANESKLWLALLRDTGRADKDRVGPLLSELDELCRIFASSLLTLRGKR